MSQPDMTTQGLITISLALYKALVRDSEKLTRLENAGVDNWDGYDKAMGND